MAPDPPTDLRDGETERLERLTAALAHQLRNPLHSMVLALALVRRGVEPSAERHLDVLDADLKRLDQSIQGFLKLIRLQRAKREMLRLDAAVEEIVEGWTPRAASRGATLTARVEDDLPAVAGDPELVREALGQLVANAVDAVGAGGSVTISVERRPAGELAVTVRDSGSGIPAATLPRVLEPYVSTKASGIGVGLTIAQRIAALHGGEITIDSVEGQGTTVVLTFPAEPTP